jgi:hypothetical protein
MVQPIEALTSEASSMDSSSATRLALTSSNLWGPELEADLDIRQHLGAEQGPGGSDHVQDPGGADRDAKVIHQPSGGVYQQCRP